MVADVIRHLSAVDLAAVSTDFGILTNSATQKSNLDRALDCGCFTTSATNANLLLSKLNNRSSAFS